ncbi:MAG TPA: hypothetical protein VNN07_15880 [Candidatus Tectomicrobia bacterium]|nr:hypothetical protein [Candidatus Tectomicrobia bacterium]
MRWGALLLVEAFILLMAIAATGRSRVARRTGGEGNRIARLLLDDPTFLESVVLYEVLFHAAIAAALLLAWLVTRRRRRARAATGRR